MRPNPAAEPAAFPMCPKHPGVPSVAPCSRCGTFLCSTCRVVSEPPLCEACAGRAQDPLGIRSTAFSIGSALVGGWKMFQGSLGTVALIALTFGIPGGLLSYWLEQVGTDSGVRLSSLGRLFDGLVGVIGLVGALWAMAGVAEGRRVSFGEALSYGLHAWGRVFVARLRAGIWIFLFCLLLIVPGIIKALALALVLPSAVLNRGDDPLEESQDLTEGFKGEILGLSLLAVVLLVALILPAGAIVGAAATFVPRLELPAEICADILGRVIECFYQGIFLSAYYGLLRTRELRDIRVSNSPL